jgi:hypothetical protein
MPCDTCLNLALRAKDARDTFAGYAYEQNRHIWRGVGERRRRRLINEWKDKISETSRALDLHRSTCPEWNKSAATNPPPPENR